MQIWPTISNMTLGPALRSALACPSPCELRRRTRRAGLFTLVSDVGAMRPWADEGMYGGMILVRLVNLMQRKTYQVGDLYSDPSIVVNRSIP